jgi:subtilisin family serine protease
MPDIIRVGLVDSGARPEQREAVAAAVAFVYESGQLASVEAQPDLLGHGGAVLAIVRHLAPGARFHIAQIFQRNHIATAAQVAAAIDWLVETGVDLINLSLGLRAHRPLLEAACRRACAAGVMLCAAAPARGAPVFPAAYEGVWRMTGDARCARGEISSLMTPHADFGAHVSPLPIAGNGHPGGGASMGCAHMSGHIAALLARHEAPSRTDPRLRAWVGEQLRQQARYHGPERRSPTSVNGAPPLQTT